jgi:hypothetical protein
VKPKPKEKGSKEKEKEKGGKKGLLDNNHKDKNNHSKGMHSSIDDMSFTRETNTTPIKGEDNSRQYINKQSVVV